jgi:hypothetical protein
MATDEEKMAQMTEAEIKESARAGISRDIESEQRRLAEVGEGFTEQAAAIRRGAAEALGAQLGRQRGMSGATLAGAEMERQAEKRQLELQEKLLKIGTPEERERETIRDVDAEAQAYDEGTDRGKFYEREAEAATTQAERDKLLNRARDELVKDFWFKNAFGGYDRQKYIDEMNKKFGPVAGSSTVGS